MRQWWAGAWFLAFCVAAGQANGQSLARTFDGVRGDLKSGDIVVVVDDAGETWGQVADTSQASLTVLAGERQGGGATFPKTSARTFSEVAVLEIWRADALGRRGALLFSRPPRSFSDLQRSLKAGDYVTIVDSNGRVSRGKLAAVSPTELTLRAGGFRISSGRTPPPAAGPRTFQADRVATVARGGDSPWNGTAIGAGIALGLGVASVASATGDATDGIAALGPITMVGAGVGFLVDWTHNRKQRLWSAAGSGTRRSAGIAPILRRDAKGVALSLRF